jgi:hypothetical protein
MITGGKMIEAVSITWRSIKDLWEDFVLLVALNLLWTITAVLPAIPLLLLGSTQLLWALILGILFLAPLPIVSGGLWFVTNQITRGVAVTWGTFGTGVRRYWAKSLLVAVINFVVLILILTNIQFYAFVIEGTWTSLALIVWVSLGGYWLLVQVFWFPMILELESEKVLVALRNALVMGILTPGFSLLMLFIIAALVVLSVILTVPLILFIAALLMLIGNHATRSRLAFAQEKASKSGEDEA